MSAFAWQAQPSDTLAQDIAVQLTPVPLQVPTTYNRIKPLRLTLAASTLDFTWHSIMTGVYASCAADSDNLTFFDYGTSNAQATCIAYTATHAVFAGLALWNAIGTAQEYRERRNEKQPIADLRWPRTSVALTTMSASYWMQELARGLVSKSSSGAEQAAGALVPAMFLVLQIPTLIMNVRDLRWVRETKVLYSKRRVEWMASPGSVLVRY